MNLSARIGQLSGIGASSASFGNRSTRMKGAFKESDSQLEDKESMYDILYLGWACGFTGLLRKMRCTLVCKTKFVKDLGE